MKLFIVLTKLNSEGKKQTVPLIGSQTVSHQQNVFTHTAQVSVTVMILFDKTLPISILTQLPPLKNMHSNIFDFSFFIELLGYKSYNVIISFDKLLSELT